LSCVDGLGLGVADLEVFVTVGASWWRREDGDGLGLGVGGFDGCFCGSWFWVFGWGGGPGLGWCGLRREAVWCGSPKRRKEEEKRNAEKEKKVEIK
jgi:hypothetical protein